MNVSVQLPVDVASEVVAAGEATAAVGHPVESLGGFADVAEIAAVIAGQAATLVTLASGPDVYRSIAARLRRLHGERGRWLQASGPGGEVSLKLTRAMDDAALSALLHALWASSDEDSAPPPDDVGTTPPEN